MVPESCNASLLSHACHVGVKDLELQLSSQKTRPSLPASRVLKLVPKKSGHPACHRLNSRNHTVQEPKSGSHLNYDKHLAVGQRALLQEPINAVVIHAHGHLASTDKLLKVRPTCFIGTVKAP